MYVIGSWLDKIEKERKEMRKWFKKLDFFSTNLKPRSALNPKQLEQIDDLVKSAFDCHLDKDDDDDIKKVSSVVSESIALSISLQTFRFSNRKRPKRRKNDLFVCCVKWNRSCSSTSVWYSIKHLWMTSIVRIWALGIPPYKKPCYVVGSRIWIVLKFVKKKKSKIWNTFQWCTLMRNEISWTKSVPKMANFICKLLSWSKTSTR